VPPSAFFPVLRLEVLDRHVHRLDGVLARKIRVYARLIVDDRDDKVFPSVKLGGRPTARAAAARRREEQRDQ